MRVTSLLQGWPGQRWWFPATGVLVAVATFAMTRSQLAAEYPRWADVSAAWHESLWVSGALAAAAAALIGALMIPRGSTLGSAVHARFGPMVWLAHAGGLSAWVVAGHALALVPIHVAAFSGATDGMVNGGDIAVGVVGAVMLTVVGFCVGVAVGHPAVGAGVAIVAFGAMGLAEAPVFRPLGLISPVRQFEASPRFEISPYTAVFTVLAAIAVVTAALVTVSWIRSRRSVRRMGRPTLASTTVVAGMVVLAFAWRPELYTVDDPVAVTCQEGSGITYCFHDANLPAMSETMTTVDAFRSAGLEPVLEEVTDAAAADVDQAAPGQVLLRLDPQPRGDLMVTRSLQEDVALTVSETMTSRSCAGQLGAEADELGVDMQSYDLMHELNVRVLQLAGYDDLAGRAYTHYATNPNRFADFDPDDIATFLTQHRAQIRGCAITADMLGL